MKKLVAISVLFAGLATAVFAQSGGWSNEWKVGLEATFQTDMFYTAFQSGKDETTKTTTPSAVSNDGTVSKEWGKYSKGVTHFFPNADPFGLGDHRVFVRIENSGENYAIRMNMGIDNKWTQGIKVSDVILGGTTEDWGVKANVGIFNLGIGPWATEAAWVDANATWGASWLAWGEYNRFGVTKWNAAGTGSYIHSNHFRTLNSWGNPFAVGIKLGDQFKFTLGYRIDWASHPIGDPRTDNRSSMNGAFMFSGSPADAIAFDLFYAITGQDTDTFSRPASLYGYNVPVGSWNNIIGAYVQVKGIENLSIMVGYTANFIAYEAGGFLCYDGDYAQSKPVTYNAPIYSGIDLRLGYTGIDKIGLKFNNNFSFAGVNGDKIAKDPDGDPNHQYAYKDKINLLFGEDFKKAQTNGGEGLTQNWFHWKSSLEVALSFIDGVPLQLSIGNKLGVTTEKLNKTEVDATSSLATFTTKTEGTSTLTKNTFRAGIGAKYGMGGATLGLGLVVQITSTLKDEEATATISSSVGSTPTVIKATHKSNDDKVEFGIPITFSLSF